MFKINNKSDFYVDIILHSFYFNLRCAFMFYMYTAYTYLRKKCRQFGNFKNLLGKNQNNKFASNSSLNIDGKLHLLSFSLHILVKIL